MNTSNTMKNASLSRSKLHRCFGKKNSFMIPRINIKSNINKMLLSAALVVVEA